MLSALLLAAPIAFMPEARAAGVEQSKSSKKGTSKKSKSKSSTANKSSSSKGSSKSNAKNSGTSKKSGKKAKSTPAKPETSADVKKRHQATQQEIERTKQQIAENERAVKNGIADLAKIDEDVKSSQAKVNATSAQVKELDNKLNGLQKLIDDNEQQLALLREKYLSAVKKMRQKRGKNNALSFIFSSKSFNQALQRMRYLKEFSDWKTKQSASIEKKVKELSYQKELLAQTKADKDRVLAQQLAARNTLEQQRRSQDALVADLKRNGQALNSHLQKKQAEANSLNSRISQLIAEEQRKAREEEARKERERLEAERRKAEEVAKAAEAKAAAEAKKLAEASSDKKENKKEEKKVEVKKDKKQKNTDKDKKKDYAEARNRAKRSNSGSAASSGSAATSSSNTSAAGADFASHKGSLPRPVSGSFRVISPFGRHPLPELPDVEYENPGIDAEVSSGSSAQAVFAGKVSGVYILPGYSTVVIINHGNYYTVYGNIAASSVKVGDSVKQGQSLGKLASDDGRTVVHFEVWKNRDKMNPMDWIK